MALGCGRPRLRLAAVVLSAVVFLAAGCEAEPIPVAENDGVPPAEIGQRTESGFPYEIETVAERLNVPWELAIAPDGRIFFTERVGNVRVIENGKLREEPVFSFTDREPFRSVGEGGLLGLALDPGFADNGYMYVYHTYGKDGALFNRVVRLRLNGQRAVLDGIVLDGLPGDRNHNGGRLKIGPDGKLYVTVGDALDPALSQKLDSLAGKILRIGTDGSIPADNPFPGSPVYSWGHRNPQGMAWHPDSGVLFASEHGQSAKDEINVIEKGANYGWPFIEGDESEPEGGNPSGVELRRPLLHSGNETWAPSGMTFVTEGPWKGQLLVAHLRGSQLMKIALHLSGGDWNVQSTERLFRDEFGRIRTVIEAPDGSLYFATNNRDGRGHERQGDDKIIRLKPKSR